MQKAALVWARRAAASVVALAVVAGVLVSVDLPEAQAEPGDSEAMVAAEDQTAVGGAAVPAPDQQGVIAEADSAINEFDPTPDGLDVIGGRAEHVAPADGAADVGVRPTLEAALVGPLPEGTRFRFRLYNDAGRIGEEKITTDSRWKIGQDLNPAVTYWWTVVAVSADGTPVAGSTETAWLFSPGPRVDAGPGAHLVGLEHGATVTTLRPEISWEFTRTVGGTTPVAQVQIFDAGAREEGPEALWTSEWLDATSVQVPAGVLQWGQQIRIEVQAARRRNDGSIDAGPQRSQTVSSREVVTEVEWDSGVLRADSSTTHHDVSLGTGGLVLSLPGATVASTGMPISVPLFYRSQDRTTYAFGAGWASMLDMRVQSLADGVVDVRAADGHVETFTERQGGGFAPVKATSSTLERRGDGTWLWTSGGNRYVFDEAGLVEITAPSNHTTKITRDDQGRIITIADVSGRKVKLTWKDRQVVKAAAVSADAEESVQWEYTYDAEGRLVKACAPQGHGESSCTELGYQMPSRPTFVTQVTDGTGATTHQVSYSWAGYVTEITDAAGAVARFTRVPKLNRDGSVATTRVHVADGQDRGLYDLVVDSSGNVLSQTGFGADGVDEKTRQEWRFDALGRRVEFTGPGGQREAWGYSGTSPQPVVHTVWRDHDRVVDHRYEYNARGQLTAVLDPRSTKRKVLAEYRYAGETGAALPARTLVSVVDGAGEETRYEYTARTPSGDGRAVVPDGLVSKVIAPGGASKSFVYRADGLVESVTDASGAVTTYHYDGLGRVTGQDRTADGKTVSTAITPGDDGRPLTSVGPRIDDAVSGVSRQIQAAFDYDAAGRVLAVTTTDLVSGDEQKVQTEYDPAGRAVREVAADGESEVTYTYDAVGCPVAVTDERGVVTKSSCDRYGRITRTVESGYTSPVTPDAAPEDRVVAQYTYDSHGRVATWTGADGVKHSYTYTVDGLVEKVEQTSTAGETVVAEQTVHDALGHPVKVTGWPGRSVENTTVTKYDANTRPVETWVRVPAVSTEHGEVLGHTRRWVNTYDADGRVVKRVLDDGAGQVETSESTVFNTAGYPVQVTVGVGDQAATTHMGYNQRGERVWQTDPRGNGPRDPQWTSEFTFDVVGNPVSVTGPQMAVTTSEGAEEQVRPRTRMGYDSFGRPSVTEDELGHRSTVTYDAKSQVVEESAPAVRVHGRSEPVAATVQMVYDRAGNVVQSTDPAGTVTRFAYDSSGNLVRTERDGATDQAAPRVTTATFNAAGQPVSAVDVDGTRTTIEYDQWGRPSTSTVAADGAERTEKMEFDLAGNLVSATSSGGGVSRWAYNVVGEMVQAIDPDGVSTTAKVNRRGQVTAVVDAAGRTSQVAYDSRGNAVAASLSNAAGEVVQASTATFDRADNQTAETGPLKTGWTATYDQANQLTSYGVSQTARYRFGYDAAGQRTAVTDPRGNTTVSAWDAAGRLVSVTEPAVRPDESLADRRWVHGYDVLGNAVHTTEPGGVQVERSFDRDGNMLSARGRGGHSSTAEATFTYTPAGDLATVSHPDGVQHFTVNGFGEMTGSHGPAGDATFAYDADGNLIEQHDRSGVTTATWSKAGRLKSVSTDAGLDQQLHYDELGRALRIEFGGDVVQEFGYDDADNLISDVTTAAGMVTQEQTATFDAAGRMTSQTTAGPDVAGAGTVRYAYDAESRLASWTGPKGDEHRYSYDAAGNATNLDGVPATYDARNRLTSMGTDVAYEWNPNGTQAAVSRPESGTIERHWDGLGRLTGDGATTYTYDGLGRVAAAGAQQFSYAGDLPEPAKIGDTPLTRSPGGTEPLASGADRLSSDLTGHVTARIDADGQVLQSRRYAPFGEQIAEGDVGPVGFQGQYTTDTGLTWMQARWYDATTHTFLSRDPYTALPPDQHNLFQYATSDPVNFSDPTGTMSAPIPTDPFQDPGRAGVGRHPGSVSKARTRTFIPHRTSSKSPSYSSGYQSGSSSRKTYYPAVKKAPVRTPMDGFQTINYAKAGLPKLQERPSGPSPMDGYRSFDYDHGGDLPRLRPQRPVAPVADSGHQVSEMPQVLPPHAGEPDSGHVPHPQVEPPCMTGIGGGIGLGTAGLCPVDPATVMPSVPEVVQRVQQEMRSALANPHNPYNPQVPAPATAPEPSESVWSKIGRGAKNLAQGIWDAHVQAFNYLAEHPDVLIDVAAIVVGTAAVAALCVGTAGAGCVLVAGIAVGAATAAGSYAAKQAIHGRAITAGGLASEAAWGAVGGAIGGGAGKLVSAGARALRPAAQGLGKAVGTAARACSFGAGTVVLAADGERVPIEDISPGDEVVATDPETGERVTRTVDASWSHVDQTVTISIDDRELVTTVDHRFWSQTVGAFVPAGDLEVGDKVVGDRGRVHTVTRTAEVGGYERVWNLSIEQVHTYHVGDTDTLVHNTCPQFGGIFQDGSIRGTTIISLRQKLLSAGYSQKLARNKKGYLFVKNEANAGNVRIMRRNGRWDVRIQNEEGNYLDEWGRVDKSEGRDSHGIFVESR